MRPGASREAKLVKGGCPAGENEPNLPNADMPGSDDFAKELPPKLEPPTEVILEPRKPCRESGPFATSDGGLGLAKLERVGAPPSVPNGEVLELARELKPDRANADDEVCGRALVLSLLDADAPVAVSGLDVLDGSVPNGDTADVFAKPLVGGICKALNTVCKSLS